MAKQEWPPEKWQPRYGKMKEYSSWYSGSRRKLMDVYSIKRNPYSAKGAFWGQNIPDGESRTMVHVPVAGDIAGVSSDLVLGAHPDFSIAEAHEEDAGREAKDAQDRLNEIVEATTMHSRLMGAAEIAASLGGVYFKVNWNTDFKDFPILSVAHPDHAIPKFKWGFLQKVTFHKVVKKNNSYTWRHLEIHEPGVIYNELYKGTDSELGDQKPLNQNPKTEDLEDEVQTGLDTLATVYVPNKLPNRLWRSSNMGASDYHGIEDLFDSLDQIYSDWMHEIEIARGKILASEEFLKNEHGDWMFDMNQTVFSPLSISPSSDEQKLEPVQFKIRAKKYKNSAIELFDRIVTAAGYAPQTFGLNIEDRADSGTALKLRKAKSERTREKKQNHLRRGLEKALKILQEIDAEHFGNNFTDYTPTVKFDDMTEIDVSATAQAIKNLQMANAASIETMVNMLHPDWGEEEKKDEIERIREEQGVSVTAPDSHV